MAEDLASTLGRVEGPSLEFKREPTDRDALRKAICALANDLVGRGGGDLLIGVDSSGDPYPVDVSDHAVLKIAQLRDDGRLLERPSMIVERATYAGAPIIRIHVHASAAPPVRLDGVAWVRPGPLSTRASADDERVLNERRTVTLLPFDSRPLPGTSADDLDLELLRSTYISAAVDPEVLDENDRPVPQQLVSLRLIHPTGAATPLGILLGGWDPTTVLPGAYLQFVRYAGLDADAPIQDDEEIRDNLITSTRTLTSLLQANVVRAVREVDGLQERLLDDYPMPALREAVLNALVHRTYESAHAPVRILWFDDRIEVTNPGGPYGTVSADNFDHVNDYRNPSLAAAMKTLGYVNRFGRGIERMRLQLLRNGNPEPEFQVDQASWRVTLRSAG